jgi:NADH dehydrogenase
VKAERSLQRLGVTILTGRTTWLLVHLWYLIGFQNRLLVLIRWSFSFATHGRSARLITDASAPSEQRDC